MSSGQPQRGEFTTGEGTQGKGLVLGKIVRETLDAQWVSGKGNVTKGADGARTSRTRGVQHTEPEEPQTQSSQTQAEGKQYRLRRTGHPFPFTCLSPPSGAPRASSLTPQTEMT